MKEKISKLIQFISHDVWRFNERKVSSSNIFIYRTIQVLFSTSKNIVEQNITAKASALTYSTLLAIVPMLALLFAVARGFGFQNIVQSELFRFFDGQQQALSQALEFADMSLKYAQGGVFVGIGLVLLLYTVINLISGVEQQFNIIWNVKKERSYYRQFTDYLALILIVPIFMVCNSGINIMLSSSLSQIYLLDHFLRPIMQVVSFLIIIGLFCFIYMYIPNTKVRFIPALIGGIVAGIVFQMFQFFYISGQIWISKYNAIYGSFAALPLLLLWLQLSWFICLVGMLLTQAIQNVKKLNMQNEVANISRRMTDFFSFLIVSYIVQRFAREEKPYSADALAERHAIPIRLTEDILFRMKELNVLEEIGDRDGGSEVYLPAFDIHKMTVSELFRRINQYGSENLGYDSGGSEKELWHVLEGFYDLPYRKYAHVKLVDIPLHHFHSQKEK